jgi:hypothetical protein
VVIVAATVVFLAKAEVVVSAAVLCVNTLPTLALKILQLEQIVLHQPSSSTHLTGRETFSSTHQPSQSQLLQQQHSDSALPHQQEKFHRI